MHTQIVLFHARRHKNKFIYSKLRRPTIVHFYPTIMQFLLIRRIRVINYIRFSFSISFQVREWRQRRRVDLIYQLTLSTGDVPNSFRIRISRGININYHQVNKAFSNKSTASREITVIKRLVTVSFNCQNSCHCPETNHKWENLNTRAAALPGVQI